jgi:hypothetical protein
MTIQAGFYAWGKQAATPPAYPTNNQMVTNRRGLPVKRRTLVKWYNLYGGITCCLT